MQTADVVIAGAGIAGIATAWQLVERFDITNIIVVDPRPPLTLTSNRTGANYRDWWPVRPMVELARRSIELMRELLHAGAPFVMNRRGYLYVSTKQDSEERIQELVRPYLSAGATPIRIHRHGAQGYEAGTRDGLGGPDGADVLFDREFIRRTWPHLPPAITGVIHARNAGTLETVGLGRHLLDTALRRGIRLVTGEVTRVDITDGRVRTVGIRNGNEMVEVSTRHFVNAAGPFAGRLAELVGVELPLINVLQQKVAVADPLGVVPPAAPFTISLDPAGSLPAGLHIKSDILAGKAVVKLGCAFNHDPEEPAWDPAGTAEFPGLVLRAAAQLLPGLQPYLAQSTAPAAHEAGYYTRTPDDLPLIGPLGHDGAWVVGGLAGYGAMVACAAGEIAASWIAGAAKPVGAAHFDPIRFRDLDYLSGASMRETSTGAL
jgi:glycine/D-amino acid oxidase-like deaminating enzyme